VVYNEKKEIKQDKQLENINEMLTVYIVLRNTYLPGRLSHVSARQAQSECAELRRLYKFILYTIVL